MAPAAEPLFRAEDLRVDVDGVPAVDGLTLRTTGDRVLVLGAPRALFEAASGLRPVVRGTLHVRGAAASSAVRDGAVASAPFDPPLPPKWTALEYITWSARLSGRSAGDARTLAAEAAQRMQLGPVAALPLERVVPGARRGIVVAAALATGAPVLMLEDPLAGLPEENARTLARILVQAHDERSWVVVAARMPLTSPLAMHADEALVVSGAGVDAQGPPAEIAAKDRRFVARIHGRADDLGARLTARGGSLVAQGAQVTLDLGESVSTADLLGMCAEADVVIVEMTPIARALA